MLIRVQGADGTQRIECLPTDSTKSLYEKTMKQFKVNGGSILLCRTRDRTSEIKSSSRTLKTSKLNHGDMVFMVPANKAASNVNKDKVVAVPGPSTQPEPSTSSRRERRVSESPSIGATQATSVKSLVEEHEVDQQLAKLKGNIERKRNPTMCRHAGNSKCIHCTPIDPWDEGYLKENKIKHLSFHSHLRKLTSGVDKGKFVYLENISCKIKPGCTDHPPWPEAICSKCQPSAITLNRQNYRHVDNVMFENPHIVERFLNYWRVTGHQRIGLLYGKYEPHLDVPLGIKAIVSAIYEPPQEGSKDHVKILADHKKDTVDMISQGLGLECVGWIFTDLVPLDPSKGTVRYSRHADTFFLSAHEVITAAHLQHLHPNPCRLSPEGVYGSKFVTVIVTGDSTNQVHMEGYQVSNQCQALVSDKCLVPTKDVPELAYVRESSSKQYIPDVYFKEKDQYGNEVVKLGRPLPVEYLLLDCPVSTPVEPITTFAINSTQFPVENRLVEGYLQDFPAVVSYMKTFTDDQFLEAVSDFHFLVFISAMDTMPLKDYIEPLLIAVKSRDKKAALEWKKGVQWATVEQLIEVSDGGPGPSMPSMEPMEASGGPAQTWTCVHCTFINQSTSNETCNMCQLPR